MPADPCQLSGGMGLFPVPPDLFEQIKGNVLENEINDCINNKENYDEFIKEKLDEYLQGGWLKQNEFDFLNSNLFKLSEKCFVELKDNMSLE